MKNLTQKQIQDIDQLQAWDSTNFHGNRKKYKGFPVEMAREIITKRYIKALNNFKIQTKENDYALIKKIIQRGKETKNTNYFKVLIEGNTGIYLASPDYMHADYNKSRLFDKNEKTLKIMQLANNILSK